MTDSDRSTVSSGDLSASSRGEDSQASSKVVFSEDEMELVARMYKLIGKRWNLIAGRIPGRSAEEIEKYWTSKFSTRE